MIAPARRNPMLIGLVGGVGSRPYPLTASRQAGKDDFKKVGLMPTSYNANAVPKPLAPLGTSPIMEPLFQDIIGSCGIQDIAMVVMYMADDIIAHFGHNMERLRTGTGSSSYWDDQRLLGLNLNTAGSVVRGWKKNLENQSDRPDTYVIPSADIRTKMDFGRMLDMHQRGNALATLALAPVPWSEVHRFGVAIREKDAADETGKYTIFSGGQFSRINKFVEKRADALSNLNNASIYIVSDRLLKLIAEDQYFEVPEGTPFDKAKNPNVFQLTSTRRLRAGIFSKHLAGIGFKIKFEGGERPYTMDDANPNFCDWGGHIFPDIVNNPEIYRAKNPGDAEGLYGYFDNPETPVLWADDGTRAALWRANLEMLEEEGGILDQKADFSWWPKPGMTETLGHNGKKIWIGEGANIEEGAMVLGPSFIGAGARIMSGAMVSRSVVGAGWTIDGKSRLTKTVLWPDRTRLGLSAGYVRLDYTLRAMILQNCLVGGGFYGDPSNPSFRFDGSGDGYALFKAHGAEQMEFGGVVIVSNPTHGTIVVRK